MTSKLAVAYDEGVSDALGAFGVRVAGELARRRMPEGPMHLGAERLARALGGQKDEYGLTTYQTRKSLEKPVRWGERASLEAGTANSIPGLPGVGDPGGV